MVEGKKISELGFVTNINDNCCFPLLSNGATKRITFAVLLENILAQLTIPENQEIKTLKEKVNNLDSSIELTDREIEIVKLRCEEIQKDVNSQDEIIVKYIKLFEELKEAYDRIEAEGMIIDGELDVDSEHAVSNKAVAQLIPEQASAENKLADKDYVGTAIQQEVETVTNEQQNYKQYIDLLPYSQIGRHYGVKAGYLRKYKKPNKICVIGNSMTCHGETEADGISWTVPDYREMAASKPNSGWVSLLQQYITKHINKDCKVFKSNGSYWETLAEGSKTFDSILPAPSFEVKEDRSYESGTLNSMLTEDVDIIIVQLNENIPQPQGTLTGLINDFTNLFNSLKERCPKAEIYAFTGFWVEVRKMQCIVKAMVETGVQPIFLPLLIQGIGDPNSFYCKTGDAIYDTNGNQIATVESMVAGHPNDDGFKIMAICTLDALFNDRSVFSNDNRLVYDLTEIENPKTVVKDLTSEYTFTSLADFQSAYNFRFSYFLLCGCFSFVLALPNGSNAVVLVKVEGWENHNIKQRFIPISSNSDEIYRTYSASNRYASYNSMVKIPMVDINLPTTSCTIEEEYLTISNDLTISSSEWKLLNKLKHNPQYIIDFNIIIKNTVGNSVEFTNLGRNNVRCLVTNYSSYPNALQVASFSNSITIPANSIIYIKYAY